MAGILPGALIRALPAGPFKVPTRVHIHAIVIADRDIQGGFNNEAYEEMRELNEQPVALTPAEKQRRDHLGQILTTNPDLKRLWGATLVSFYLIGNCKETAACPVSARTPGSFSKRTKGTRLVAYGKAFPRVLVVPRGKSWIRFQERLGVVLHGLNMPKEFMKIRFGRRWCFYVRHFIFPILIERFGPDMPDWPSEEVGELTSRELARFDRWFYTGPSRDLVAWRTAPGWRELGFRSHEDYILSMVSHDMSGPSMPLPTPGKKMREKKVPTNPPAQDPDEGRSSLYRALMAQSARSSNRLNPDRPPTPTPGSPVS